MKKLLVSAFLSVCLATPHMAWALTHARDTVPLHPGTDLILFYYFNVSANKLYSDGNKVGPSDDYNKSVNMGAFRYGHYFSAGNSLYGDGPFVIMPQIIVPFANINLSGNYEAHNNGKEFSTTGFGDPWLLSTFWPVNDPKHRFWVAFSPWLSIPLGQYDRNRPVSVGHNRWIIKPETAITKGFGEKTLLELVLYYEIYGDNDKFLGSNKKEQDGLFGTDVHLSYDLTKQFVVSLDYYFTNGGETRINGVSQRDKQENHGLGISLFYMIGTNNQIMLSYRDDFSVKSGAGDNTFAVRWAYVF
jgi:hypothetical protein